MTRVQRLALEIALLVGLPTLAIIYVLWPVPTGEEDPSRRIMVRVLIARKDLSMGDTITVPEQMFEEIELLKGATPPGAIKDWTNLRGKMMRRSLRTGDWVLEDDIFSLSPAMPLVPPGHRCVGIRLSDEQMAAGFTAPPTSRVDIVFTSKAGEGPMNQVMLEDVIVVPTDGEMMRPEGYPRPQRVVTVAVKAEDALKIALARQTGTLTLQRR